MWEVGSIVQKSSRFETHESSNDRTETRQVADVPQVAEHSHVGSRGQK